MNLRPDINPENIPESFKKWFNKNESKLIWNEQAKGYNSNTNINISELSLSVIPIQFNIVKGNFYCYNNQLISLEGCPKKVEKDFYCLYNNLISLKGCPKEIKRHFYCFHNNLDINEFVEINCINFVCDKYYKQSKTYKYWNLKNKLKNL